MLGKLSILNLGAREAWYHRICRTRYQRQAETAVSATQRVDRCEESTQWHQSRNLHDDVFSIVRDFVNSNVVENKIAFYSSELFKLYRSNLIEKGIPESDINYKSSKFLNKLKGSFGDKIVIVSSSGNKGSLIYNQTMSLPQSLSSVQNDNRQLEQNIREVAFSLRDIIRKCRKRPLPENFTVEDVLKGEADTPDPLKSFYSHLIMGPRLQRGETERKKRRIECLSKDAIYAVTDGKIRPKKHLKLGLAIKKLTGSKKVAKILNKCGYIPSYDVNEELETELTSSITNTEELTPFGAQKGPDLNTGLGFDNYDKRVETLTGKDTLHDTVGILYQNISQDSTATPSPAPTSDISISRRKHRNVSIPVVEETNLDGTPASNVQQKRAKKRRTLDCPADELEPYRKRPKMTCTVNTDDFQKSKEPDDYMTAVYKDLLWVLYVYLNPDQPLLWTGWNSEGISVGTSGTQQKVFYLKQINQFPTSTTVVAETLRRSLRILSECKLNSIAVTFDLAIAKVAYQIQATEAPAFDAIFINLGAFHIELAYFNAIGKYIAESGGPYILMESGVLVSGSLNGFIKGKHYNRCKRLHMLLVAALQILRMQEFLHNREDGNNEVEVVRNEVKNINKKPMDVDNLSSSLRTLLDSYKSCTEDTLNGQYGCTAKYWMGYIEMVTYWLQLSRSVREGNFDLYIFSLKNISKYFFTFNQPNYARWLTQYHNKLLNIKDTHPDVEREFRSGGFGVCRSGKDFCRNPIDLTLEQTINADAASEKSGISHFTNSVSARQRWAQSHSVTLTILSSLLEDLGLSAKEDVSRELKPCRIRRNAADLKKIISLLKDTMNPFNPDLDKECLFNIGSGKAATDATKKFLLSVSETGSEAQENFISECTANPKRFEDQSISRTEMHTFANEGAKRKVKLNGKVKEMKMERDLFAKILCLALDQEIDMGEVLKYPLTPIPLAFCHYDGTLRDTPKSKLSEELKTSVISSEPTYTDTIIIDGNFYLYLLTDLPATFGGVSRKILAKISSLKAERIDIVFDQIQTPSIKDYERDQRAQSNDRTVNYQILGPEQKRPSNFRDTLRNDAFKDALIGFLVNSWEDDCFASVIGEKLKHITHREQCFLFTSSGEKVLKEEVQALRSTHEEADCRMFLHLHSLPENQNVVIRSNDADVLIIALGLASVMDKDLWIEHGFATDNSLQYIHINQIINEYGITLCEALPGLHAFTGCDYTPAFSRRGKVKPLRVLKKSIPHQQAFVSLGKSHEIDPEAVDLIQQFVCKLYGSRKKVDSVDAVRLAQFLKAYKPKKNKPLLSLKVVSSVSMLPCFRVLYQQILRTRLISAIWLKAYQNDPPSLNPTVHGFELNEGKYFPRWFEGDVAPSSIESISLGEEADEEEGQDCSGDEDSGDEEGVELSDGENDH